MPDKKLYNCILSQVFSPCGSLLVCGNIYGDICVFDLNGVIDCETSEKGPKSSFSSPNGEQVCSLASTSRFLVAGTSGAIFAWDWDTVRNSQPELSWTINLPSAKDRLQKADVNALIASQNEIRPELFAGCGDNMIYSFSLEDGKLLRTFEGHSDYVHSLSSIGWQMASASEDGSVRLWDMRQGSVLSKIEPHKQLKLARNHFGKWIGDVSITNDWMVCGGGPRCSLWNMRTMDMMTSFSELPDFEIHVARIHGDSVLCGGASSHFFQSTFTGQLVSKMSTSAVTIYSALFSNSPREVLTLAGSSNNIDICTNFTYRHKVLKFYT